jgi:hypothetical protein
MNVKAMAVGFVLMAPFAIAGEADAAKPQGPAGGLSVYENTATAYFVGVKKSDTVRLQAICQTPDTSVVWSQADTITESPTKITYYPPAGLSCRSDLFTVAGGGKITYLENVSWSS